MTDRAQKSLVESLSQTKPILDLFLAFQIIGLRNVLFSLFIAEWLEVVSWQHYVTAFVHSCEVLFYLVLMDLRAWLSKRLNYGLTVRVLIFFDYVWVVWMRNYYGSRTSWVDRVRDLSTLWTFLTSRLFGWIFCLRLGLIILTWILLFLRRTAATDGRSMRILSSSSPVLT